MSVVSPQVLLYADLVFFKSDLNMSVLLQSLSAMFCLGDATGYTSKMGEGFTEWRTMVIYFI